MFYSIGIDIAKDDFKACLLLYNPIEQVEQVITNRTFTNTRGGIKQFERWISKHVAKKPAPIRCTMEATGVYYEQLALYILHEFSDWALSVVLPSQARKFNESEGLKNKTDKIDARGLALMGARKKLPLWKGIKPFWSKLRQLTRTRAAMVGQLTQLKNQRHALRHSGYTVDETAAIVQTAIDSLQKQVHKLDVLIKQHLESDAAIRTRIDNLRSIPSIGQITIATILAETLGFEYFSSKSQLISYSGYDVRTIESGKYIGQRKISKMGNSRIRKAMFMPAGNVLSRKGSIYHNYYMRMMDKHGVKMKAHVALQKKLLSCMYFIWKKNEPFDQYKALGASSIKEVAPHKGEATEDTSASQKEAVFFVVEN